MRGTSRFAFCLTVACLLSAGPLWAQAPEAKKAEGPPAAEKPKAEITEVDDLAARQSRVADKYDRLEKLMLRMSELEASLNPKRAALLKEAVSQSGEKLTRVQLEQVVKLIGSRQWKKAIEGQTEADTDLKALLQLLLSENRADRLKSEQQRIKEYIKEVERLIRLEKGIQGRTEGAENPADLAKNQGDIAKRAAELAKKIKDNEEGGDQNEGKPNEGKPDEGKPNEGKPNEGKPNEGKPNEGKPNESKPNEGKPNEGKPSEGKPSEGKPSEGKPSEGKPSEGKPSEGKPSEGKPSEGKPSEGKPSEGDSGKGNQDQQKQNENPARKRIEAAEQKMKEAQQRLEEAKRKEAVEAQEQAKKDLEAAKAELEEILRQMREEEIERTLAMLEGRFRKMLEMELKIYESTKRLAKASSNPDNREVEIQAGKLSFEQRKVAVEADKALTLLHEEGSSIAFPESVEQIRDDMEQVATWLSAAKVGTLTQGLEEDIIQALEEAIEALEKAQENQEQKKQDPPPPQNGQPQDQPLVDKIAELKMIRAMQVRVNKKTQRYARLLDDADDPVGQAPEGELREAIAKEGLREQKIQQITRDVELGKNK